MSDNPIDLVMRPDGSLQLPIPEIVNTAEFSIGIASGSDVTGAGVIWLDLNPPPEGWTINGVPPDPQPLIVEEKP